MKNGVKRKQLLWIHLIKYIDVKFVKYTGVQLPSSQCFKDIFVELQNYISTGEYSAMIDHASFDLCVERK